jgi:Flp pilus assembly protein CpaB
MDLEMIVFLVLAVLFFGGIALVVRKSNRKQNVSNAGNPADPATNTPPVVEQKESKLAGRK